MGDNYNKELTLERADAALLSRDFTLAARLYKSVLKDDSLNIDILQKLGTCYVRSGEDEKALEPYLRVLRLDNTNFEALNNLGGIYRRLGKYKESVKVLEAALKLGINTNEVNYNLGHTYKLMGHYDAASESFYAVVDSNPNDVLAYNHLGTIQAARGEHTKALQTYWRALQIDPNHPVLHYNSALSFTALGKYEEAISSYENVMRTKPGWTEAIENYVSLLISQKKYNKAEELLHPAIQDSPNNINYHNNLGKIFYKKGKLDNSEGEYKKSIEIDRDNAVAINGLAKIYEKTNRYLEVAPLLQKLKKIVTDKKLLENVDHRQAALLINQNKLQEAAKLLQNLRNESPDNVEILNLLAQFFIKSENRNKERGCYKKIKSLDPTYVKYLRDCGEVHTKMGNFGEGENLLKKYLEINPFDTKALTILGQAAESQNNNDSALKTYQAILELEPENSIALNAVSRIGAKTASDRNTLGLITDILNKTTEDSSLEQISDSIKVYENTVKTIDSEPIDFFEEDDKNIVLDLAKDIEEESEIDLNELYTYDMNESIDFSENEDEVVALGAVDEESNQKERRMSEDLPIDYEPMVRETGLYDPFEGSSESKYDIGEENSSLDVDGTFGYDDEIDMSIEEPNRENLSTLQLSSESPKIITQPVAQPSVQPSSFSMNNGNQNGYSAGNRNPYGENFQKPAMTKENFSGDDLDFSTSKPTSPKDFVDSPKDSKEDLTKNDFEEDLSISLEDDDLYEDDVEYTDLVSDEELDAELNNEVDNELDSVLEKKTEQKSVEEESIIEEDIASEEILAAEDDPIADFEAENISETNAALEEIKNQEDECTLDSVIKLLKYLREICLWLPEDKKLEYQNSPEKALLDALVAKHSSAAGLFGAALAARQSEGVSEETPSQRAEEKPLQREGLLETINYLQSLSAFLPNPQHAAALEREAARVLEKL